MPDTDRPDASPSRDAASPPAGFAPAPTSLTGLSGPSPWVPSGAATESAWAFARVEEFWSRFSPLTPYGRDAKEERAVLLDRGAIEEMYDATGAALSFLANSEGSVIDRITHHLRRLPRLPIGATLATAGPAGSSGQGVSLDLVELFQIKKFFSNYRAILSLLDESARSAFGLDFESARLGARLDLGGSDPETFFLADAYHPALRGLRERIAALDEAILLERRRLLESARDFYDLDFSGRDFLIVDAAAAAALVAACAEPRPGTGSEPGATATDAADQAGRPSLVVEAYDGRSCIVRLQDGEAMLRLEAERSLLLSREREAEEEAVASLSADVSAEAPRMARYVAAICDFDLALARARLAREFGLTRPDLGSEALVVENGRFLPCLWDCEDLGLRYTPLNLELVDRVAVVFGSNMGGKTVALQSVLFLQILAQAGFFVPAARFATSVRSRLDYVGETAGRRFRDSRRHGARAREIDGGRGLSGFGFEILGFIGALGAARDLASAGAARADAFIVFDEFARTTSSREAEAILSAAIEVLAARSAGLCLFSTHFHGIRRSPGVRYLRMCGLDRAAARAAIVADEPLADRIRKINGMMRYEIIDEGEGIGTGSDAIAIASLLGLDEDIVELASSIYDSGA